MKVVFAILLTVMATNATKDSSELRQIASNLLENISATLQRIQNLRENLQNMPNKIKEDDNIDFRFYNDIQIKDIEQKLVNYAKLLNKNVTECRNQYDTKRQSLIQNQKNILQEETIKEAKSINASTNYVEQKLSTISANLQPPQLEEEISLCTSSDICKLTGEFSERIGDYNLVIENLENKSQLIVDFVFLIKIKEQLQKQIDPYIYVPIYKCLSNL